MYTYYYEYTYITLPYKFHLALFILTMQINQAYGLMAILVFHINLLIHLLIFIDISTLTFIFSCPCTLAYNKNYQIWYMQYGQTIFYLKKLMNLL